MRRIEKKSESAIKALESFLGLLRRKYGPTFTVDMSRKEQSILVSLRDRVDFLDIVADGVTCDLAKGLRVAA